MICSVSIAPANGEEAAPSAEPYATYTWELPDTSGKPGDVTAKLNTNTGLLSITGNGPVGEMHMSGSGKSKYWWPYRTHIKSISMSSSVRPVSMAWWFTDCTGLTSLSSSNLRIPSSVTDTRDMFMGCTNLTSLPAGLLTSATGLRIMTQMFRECTSLKTLPSSFTLPSGVTDIGFAFSYSGLTALPGNFKIPASAEKANAVFQGCKSLTQLPAGFAISSGVKDISQMFLNCNSLTALPAGFTIPDSVETVRALFSACSSLTSLPAGFTLPKGGAVKNAESLFNACTALTELPAGFTIPASVKEAGSLFGGCTALTELPADFTVSEGVEKINGLFSNCKNLTSLPAGFTLPASAKNVSALFQSSGIAELPETFAIPSGVEEAQGMFGQCRALTELPEGFTVPTRVTDVSRLFMGTGITHLPEGFTIPAAATNTEYMFYNCPSLTRLPDGFTIPAGVVDMADMFRNCPSLTRLPDSFTILSAANPSRLFEVDATAKMVYKGDDARTKALPWESYNRVLLSVDDIPFYRNHGAGQPEGEPFYRAPILDNATVEAPTPAPEAPSPDVALNGWYTAPDYLDGALWDFGSTVTDATALYARWSPACTVAFDAQGGSAVPAQKVFTGDSATRPVPDPTRPGYTLAGWFADTAGSTAHDFAGPIAEDMTLYAGWSPITYHLVFDANGGSGTPPAKVPVTYDANATLPENSFEREGYTFIGWNTRADGTGEGFEAGEETAAPPNLADTDGTSVTLYAHWQADIISVTVDIGQAITVDAAGDAASSRAVFSTTDSNVPVRLAEVLCTEEPGAARIVPDPGQRAALGITMTAAGTKEALMQGRPVPRIPSSVFGRLVDRRTVPAPAPLASSDFTVSLGKGGVQQVTTDAFVLAPPAPGTSTELPVDFSLAIPPGTALSYLGQDAQADLATLVFVFEKHTGV